MPQVVLRCLGPILVGLGLVVGSGVSGWFRADYVGWVYTALAAVLVLLLFRRDLDWVTLGLSSRSLREAKPYLFSFVAIAVALLAVGSQLGFPGIENVTPGARATTGEGLAAILIRILVVTSLLEETIFRGALWAATSQRAGPYVALSLSAVTYGLWHVGGSIHAFRVEGTSISILLVLRDVAVTSILGLLLGSLRMKTAGIWAGILAHALINGTGAIAYFLATL